MREITIGNRVRVGRVEAGLTQQELAEHVGVTRQTIGLIEANKYNPSIKLCLMIAHITGKSLDNLFWMENDEGTK